MLLRDLLGDVENDRLDLDIGLVLEVEIGDKDLMLSRHLTSVSKCSIRSSLLTAMLQIGQITSASLPDTAVVDNRNLLLP